MVHNTVFQYYWEKKMEIQYVTAYFKQYFNLYKNNISL